MVFQGAGTKFSTPCSSLVSKEASSGSSWFQFPEVETGLGLEGPELIHSLAAICSTSGR